MSTPFLAEIRMFGGNFAPRNFAFCNGQTIAIVQNQALFALLGTTYGGDGQNTFGLPDLRGRVPIHAGQGSGLGGYVNGQAGGEATHTLTTNELASHNHLLFGVDTATTTTPGSSVQLGAGIDYPGYGTGGAGSILNPAALSPAPGSGQPHQNLQPFLAVNFIIAIQGIFPSRN